MSLGLNNIIDTSLFNQLLMKGGGSPIITKKKLISMKAFISLLLKVFRKDYNSQYKKGGDSSELGIFNVALKYGDLNYSKSYEPSAVSSYERDFI